MRCSGPPSSTSAAVNAIISYGPAQCWLFQKTEVDLKLSRKLFQIASLILTTCLCSLVTSNSHAEESLEDLLWNTATKTADSLDVIGKNANCTNCEHQHLRSGLSIEQRQYLRNFGTPNENDVVRRISSGDIHVFTLMKLIHTGKLPSPGADRLLKRIEAQQPKVWEAVGTVSAAYKMAQELGAPGFILQASQNLNKQIQLFIDFSDTNYDSRANKDWFGESEIQKRFRHFQAKGRQILYEFREHSDDPAVLHNRYQKLVQYEKEYRELEKGTDQNRHRWISRLETTAEVMTVVKDGLKGSAVILAGTVGGTALSAGVSGGLNALEEGASQYALEGRDLSTIDYSRVGIAGAKGTAQGLLIGGGGKVVSGFAVKRAEQMVVQGASKAAVATTRYATNIIGGEVVDVGATVVTESGASIASDVASGREIDLNKASDSGIDAVQQSYTPEAMKARLFSVATRVVTTRAASRAQPRAPPVAAGPKSVSQRIHEFLPARATSVDTSHPGTYSKLAAAYDQYHGITGTIERARARAGAAKRPMTNSDLLDEIVIIRRAQAESLRKTASDLPPNHPMRRLVVDAIHRLDVSDEAVIKFKQKNAEALSNDFNPSAKTIDQIVNYASPINGSFGELLVASRVPNLEGGGVTLNQLWKTHLEGLPPAQRRELSQLKIDRSLRDREIDVLFRSESGAAAMGEVKNISGGPMSTSHPKWPAVLKQAQEIQRFTQETGFPMQRNIFFLQGIDVNAKSALEQLGIHVHSPSP
jgi:hypothetical protein